MSLRLRIERDRDDRYPDDVIAQLRAENEALRRELARERAAHLQRGVPVKTPKPRPKADALEALSQARKMLTEPLTPVQVVMLRGLLEHVEERVTAIAEIKRARKAPEGR
jgi:hypothetical protein